MSYICNKCGKVVSDKWAHNIEHAFKEWDEEEQVLFSKL
jgi:DNA-directed RNA polymerase subunit N (RpoN/RPB10)